MEALDSTSLGAMGSLHRKLDELLHVEDWAPSIRQLREIVDSISTKLMKLLEVHDPPHTVNYWKKDVRELSYDLEDCVDQIALADTADAKLALIDEISGLRSQAEEMIERYDRFNLDYILSHPAVEIPVISHVLFKPSVPVGMECQTNELLGWLEPRGDDENERHLKVVSILGVSGVGKSTLAQELWHQLGLKIECRAFVKATKKPDMRMILRSILSQVSPNQPPKNCKVPNLIRDIRKHLEDKRYFVIIDDIWAVSIWDALSRAFPDGHSYSRIITTTTIEDVALACCSYDPERIFKMKPLSADHSTELFISTVFGYGKGCPQQFQDVADEITRKCGGLPLAITSIATLVASLPETVQQWELVQNFFCHNSRTNSTSEEVLKQVLKLCYACLPQYLETCLLYLSVYPENYIVLKEDLVKQWVAEGFICTIEGKDNIEVAQSYFDELVSLGLIQRVYINSKKKRLSYAVHPAVFDFITCKSIEDNFNTIIDYSQSTIQLFNKIRRLSLHFGSATYATIPVSIGLSQVRSLAFVGLFNCIPSLEEFKLVRVVILHFRGDNGDMIFPLAEICGLLLLRYLQVRCNVTVELPDQIQCLKHLETLEIIARVASVPSGILNVSSLLHVHLGEKANPTLGPAALSMSFDDSIGSSSFPAVFFRKFELLPPICIFTRLPVWIRQLRKLCILEITVREVRLDDISVLAELPALAALSLYVRTPSTVPIFLSKVGFQALEYLKFVCREFMLGFCEEAMPNLRRLKIGFNVRRGGEYKYMLVGIPNLLKLEEAAAKIGADTGAEESDRTSAESALRDNFGMHQCHPSFKVTRVDRVDGEYDPCERQNWNQQKESSNEREMVQCRKQMKEQLVQGLKFQERFYGGIRKISNDNMWSSSSMTQPRGALDENKRPTSKLKLAFRRPPRVPLYTDTKIVDIAGNPLEIILVDADTGSPAAIPQALRVELVLVLADFPPDDWAADEFQKRVVKEREGKRPLLAGEVSLTMRDGRATVGELQFTDSSRWFRGLRLRIGVRVVPGSYDGPSRIQEAVTEAFIVKERRTMGPEKHDPPALHDDVWRLKRIARGGIFHTRLEIHDIRTVQDFLRMLMVKPGELRAILNTMTGHSWEETTSHAKSCVLDDRVYVYTTANGTVYLNSIFDVVRAEIGGVEWPRKQLNSAQTALKEQLVLEAYENQHSLKQIHEGMLDDIGLIYDDVNAALGVTKATADVGALKKQGGTTWIS